jgi:hypothetical protein
MYYNVLIIYMKFTLDYTNMIARQLRFKGNLHSFWLGMNAESEYGNVYMREDLTFKDSKLTKNNILTTKNPRSNTKSNDNILTAKIAISHLDEKPDYYKVDKMVKK